MKKEILLYILLIIGGLLEILAVCFGLAKATMLFTWVFHILAVIALAGSLYLRGQNRSLKDNQQSLYVYALLFFACFPGLGVLGAALLLVSVHKGANTNKGKLYEEYEDYIKEKPKQDVWLGHTLNILRDFREEVSFEPFIDILTSTKTQVKANVIFKLSKDTTASSIRLIKLALKDENPEVRLYAANALVKVEARLNEKIRIAERRAKKYATAEAFRELGELYQRYAFSEIASESLRKYFIQKSIDAFQSSLDSDSDQPQVIVSYCRNAIELAQFDKAHKLVAHALTIWPTNAELIFLSNEIDFLQGNYNNILERFKKVDQEELKYFEKEIYDTWHAPKESTLN